MSLSPVSAPPAQSPATARWICESCGFIYDPSEGDPTGGVAPGTSFEELPANWCCPVCGAPKSCFEPYDT